MPLNLCFSCHLNSVSLTLALTAQTFLHESLSQPEVLIQDDKTPLRLSEAEPQALSFILHAHQVLSYKEQQPPHVIFKKGKLQKAFAVWRFEDGAEPGLEAPPGTKPQIRSELGQGRYCRHHSWALAQTPANAHSQHWTLGACHGTRVPVALETKLSTTALLPLCPGSVFVLLQNLGEPLREGTIQAHGPTTQLQKWPEGTQVRPPEKKGSAGKHDRNTWTLSLRNYPALTSSVSSHPAPFSLMTESRDKPLLTHQHVLSGSCLTLCPVDLRHL